ncbi:phosphotransferase [Paractinoplanes aksuensis]|uniref:phosphotransferase n=1 Tax=Paractinoplanes aksuensis TaxID=2939490 RepID=UPI0034DB00F6
MRIDSGLVRRLVDAQFPQWSNRPLRLVDPAGSDHVIYRLGDELSVRLPRHEGAIDQARVEAEWLPQLAPHLPLAVPVPVAVGQPAFGYPWSWAVTRWLSGDVATVAADSPSPIPGTSPYAEAFVPLLGTWQSLAHDDSTPSPPPKPARAETWPSDTHAQDETSRLANRSRDDTPRPGARPRDDTSRLRDRARDAPFRSAGVGRRAASVEHVRGLSLPVSVPLGVLAELESRWLTVLLRGDALHHVDLRRDNFIREPDGRLRIVDWTPCGARPAGWISSGWGPILPPTATTRRRCGGARRGPVPRTIT